MLQSNMGHVASRDTHSRFSKKPSLPLQKPTPSLSQYLPRPSQREGARACGPGECCIASALAVNTARGVERVSRFCARSRGLVCGGIWKNIERVSHFCARICGNVCGDIWRNTEFASNLRSPSFGGVGGGIRGFGLGLPFYQLASVVDVVDFFYSFRLVERRLSSTRIQNLAPPLQVFREENIREPSCSCSLKRKTSVSLHCQCSGNTLRSCYQM